MEDSQVVKSVKRAIATTFGYHADRSLQFVKGKLEEFGCTVTGHTGSKVNFELRDNGRLVLTGGVCTEPKCTCQGYWFS